MKELIDALKSIVQGLESQTKSDSIKWLTGKQYAKTDKSKSYYDNNEEKLELYLFHILDSSTVIKYHCYIGHNHEINNSWLSIENSNLQDGRLVITSGTFPEYQDLEDVLYDKYLEPILNSYKLNYDTDLKVLESIVGKCGIEAVRDFKLNSLLGGEEKGFFNKIFGK